MLTDDVRPIAGRTVQILKNLGSGQCPAGRGRRTALIFWNSGRDAAEKARRISSRCSKPKTIYRKNSSMRLSPRWPFSIPVDVRSLRAKPGERERKRRSPTRRRNSISDALDFLSSDESTARKIAAKSFRHLVRRASRSEVEFHSDRWDGSPPLQATRCGTWQGQVARRDCRQRRRHGDVRPASRQAASHRTIDAIGRAGTAQDRAGDA